MMASRVLFLFQLLLLTSLVSASHHWGGTLNVAYKGRNPDGSFKMSLRARDTYDSCVYTHYWSCYSGNCGISTSKTKTQIDSSTNVPSYKNQWCETELVETWTLLSDKPLKFRASSCCWLPTRNSVQNWRLDSLVDFGTRSDTMEPNKSPEIAIVPFLRVPENCPRTYKLAAFDPDGDRVRCRYGNLHGFECDNCHLPSGFQLDQDSCTLHYQQTSHEKSVFGFEMVVEDYPHSTIDLSYSDGSSVRKHPMASRGKRSPSMTSPAIATTTTTTTHPTTMTTTTRPSAKTLPMTTTITTTPPSTALPMNTTTTTTPPSTALPMTTITTSPTTALPMTTTTTSPTTAISMTTTTTHPSTALPMTTTITTTTHPTTALPMTTTTTSPTTALPMTTTTTTTPPSTALPITTTTTSPTTALPMTTTTTTTPPSTALPITTTTTSLTTALPMTTTTTSPTTALPMTTTTTTTTHATTALPMTTTPPSTALPMTTTTTSPTTALPRTTTTTITTLPTTALLKTTTTTKPQTTALPFHTTTTRLPTAALPFHATSTTAPSTTPLPLITSSTPLSKLPLQFSFLVDPPVPSCQEGLYLPHLVAPTPRHGERIVAEVQKELEIRVKAQASHSIIQNIIFSGPSNVTKHRDINSDFVIRWTPVKDDLGGHFPICFAVESQNGSSVYQSEMRCVLVEIRKEQIKAQVTCTETTMKVEVEKQSFFGLQEDHLRLSDPSNTICSLKRNSNSSHIVAIIPLNGCGTQIEEDDDYLIFKNEITTVEDNPTELVTRKHLVEARFYCQYPKRGNVTLSFSAHRKNVTVWERGFGTFIYQFEFYQNDQFGAMFDPNSYPLEFDIGNRIYMQLDASSSVNNTEMFVESCRAAPYDNPNYHPTYSIIENGCKVDPTLQIYSTPQNRQFRFSMEAFKFIGLHDQVYISCTVMMCEAGNPNTRCSKGCMNSTMTHSPVRRKREAVVQSGKHLVSQGPLRLRREANPKGGSGRETILKYL
ncbi:uncharacterized protein LOC119788853 isoform X1 [Cyprinodon tularosa]|uniref:uncharacterized protein LOC119788853 isoform X1 n=1 Tax=Cyprinodon tularosa TaxID=77115 RepID=UPI0018E24B6C|nr:uncharacterized protein LOC119788853 isoform X1 [Cyprinodon tularosa]